MRCNPWRWLWGVIPIAMLTWLAITWEREGIETDLQTRAESALRSKGYGWGRIDIEGRDILLSGVAPDNAEPYRASKAVREVKGVRIVRTRTDARSDKAATADASGAKEMVGVEDGASEADVSISDAKVKSKKGGFIINEGQTGPVAARLREALLNIQHGHAEDAHGWMHRVL